MTYGDRFIVQERQAAVTQEPMTLWRYSKPQSAKYKQSIQMPAKHRVDVALWRGLASVTQTGAQCDEHSPAVSRIVDHAARLRRSSLLPAGLVRYRAIGVEYGSQESVVDEVTDDSLDLPGSVLDPEARELRAVALDGVATAAAGVKALADLARGLARAAGAGTEEVQGPGNRAYEQGYSALDPFYRNWLRDELAGSEADPRAAERAWQLAAERVLLRLGDTLVSGVPDKAWVGFGASGRRDDVGAVYQRFRRTLRATFPLARPDEPAGHEASTQLTKETV